MRPVFSKHRNLVIRPGERSRDYTLPPEAQQAATAGTLGAYPAGVPPGSGGLVGAAPQQLQGLQQGYGEGAAPAAEGAWGGAAAAEVSVTGKVQTGQVLGQALGLRVCGVRWAVCTMHSQLGSKSPSRLADGRYWLEFPLSPSLQEHLQLPNWQASGAGSPCMPLKPTPSPALHDITIHCCDH